MSRKRFSRMCTLLGLAAINAGCGADGAQPSDEIAQHELTLLVETKLSPSATIKIYEAAAGVVNVSVVGHLEADRELQLRAAPLDLSNGVAAYYNALVPVELQDPAANAALVAADARVAALKAEGASVAGEVAPPAEELMVDKLIEFQSDAAGPACPTAQFANEHSALIALNQTGRFDSGWSADTSFFKSSALNRLVGGSNEDTVRHELQNWTRARNCPACNPTSQWRNALPPQELIPNHWSWFQSTFKWAKSTAHAFDDRVFGRRLGVLDYCAFWRFR